MTPYGDKDLGSHWPRQWLVAWRHQTTWPNVEKSPAKCFAIHLRVFSQKMLTISIFDMSLKITYLRLQPHLQGVNELTPLLMHFKLHFGFKGRTACYRVRYIPCNENRFTHWYRDKMAAILQTIFSIPSFSLPGNCSVWRFPLIHS